MALNYNSTYRRSTRVLRVIFSVGKTIGKKNHKYLNIFKQEHL